MKPPLPGRMQLVPFIPARTLLFLQWSRPCRGGCSVLDERTGAVLGDLQWSRPCRGGCSATMGCASTAAP